jgi:membrane-associated protease RseP (regulator of RpoE activity)
MNGTNGWKWVAIVLMVVLVLLGCCLVSGVFGGMLGYAFGRTSRHMPLRQMPFPEERPDMPGIPPQPDFPELPFPEDDEEREAEAWLGVFFRMTTEGAEVREVVVDSPADSAGLERGDVITRVDGKPVTEAHPLNERILAHEPGDEVELTILRDDDEVFISVELGKRPPQPTFDEEFFVPQPSPGSG